MLLAVSQMEFDLIKKALAVAAKTEGGVEMFKLNAALDARASLGGEAWQSLKGAKHALRSYEYGNASTELAAGIADACDVAMSRISAVTGDAASEV